MKKVLLLLLTCLSFYSYGQQCDVVVGGDGSSGRDTPPACDYNAANTEKYCMNLYFHIVRDNNGANGFTGSLTAIVDKLNLYFNPHNIYFTSIGYDYIDNTNLNDVADTAEFMTLTNTNVVSNAINIYLVNNLYAAGVARLNNYRCVVENGATANSVPAHEVGHCLNLQHTFYVDPGPGGCAETPSTCLTCGDYVCDTVGDTNTTNIMSYYSPTNHFSAGQGLRMRNSIKCHRTAQRTNLCATLTGANRICSTGSSTYTLNNVIPGTAVTWSVTSNLQIVSSNATSITVQASTSTTNGMATITANVGGVILTKNIFIGKPSFNVVRDNVEYCEGSWHYVYIEIVNFDTTTPTTGYTYSFVTPPGITYTAMGNNYFRFRLPQNYVGYFELLATVTNSCGSVQSYTEQDVKLCGTFTYQYPRGVAESGPTASSRRYTIFPNPADNAINIALVDPELHDNARISADLYDMLGQSKGQVDIVDGEAVMDVSQLRQGIYVIKINVDGVVETHQVMIK